MISNSLSTRSPRPQPSIYLSLTRQISRETSKLPSDAPDISFLDALVRKNWSASDPVHDALFYATLGTLFDFPSVPHFAELEYGFHPREIGLKCNLPLYSYVDFSPEEYFITNGDAVKLVEHIAGQVLFPLLPSFVSGTVPSRE